MTIQDTSLVPAKQSSALATAASTINSLMNKIPTNEYGLPLGIYRLDLLPQDGSIDYLQDPDADHEQAQELRKALSNAFLPLEYHEGFPTLPDGRPLWLQLSFELPEAFQAFEAFLHQPTLVPSNITGVSGASGADECAVEYGVADALKPRSPSLHSHLQGSRQLCLLEGSLERSHGLRISLTTLQEYFHVYCWSARAKAYDLFRVASVRKQQEQRAMDTVDEHYTLATRLLSKLALVFDNEEDFWDILTPKAAIDLLKTLTQLQRLSSGLPAASPAASGVAGAGAGSSMELILRNLAQANNEGAPTIEAGSSTESLNRALRDPATAQLAQELVIKLQNF